MVTDFLDILYQPRYNFFRAQTESVVCNDLPTHLKCYVYWVWSPVRSNKYCYIGVCFFSAKQAVSVTTGRFLVRIMCRSGAKCLSEDCCFSELALRKLSSTCWSIMPKKTSSSHQQTCSLHDLAEKCLNWHKTTITHSRCIYIARQFLTC